MLNKRRKILVVDDERAIVSARATIFESQGYETATAYSGEEAVRVACRFHPDCIVSDVMMGAMNGVEAAIEIVGVLPQCKVLFISGNVGYGDLLEKARAKGFNFQALAKPVHVPELLSRISQICPQSPDQTASQCSHLNCNFPTIAKKPGSVSLDGEPRTAACVICLDCGKEFLYDWELTRLASAKHFA